MVLNDGHVDELVTVQERVEDGPATEDVTRDVRGLHARTIGQQHFGARFARRSSNPRPIVGTARIVAGHVTNDDSSSPGFSAELDEGRYDEGVGVCGEQWDSVPTDVGLDEDAITPFDEASDTTDCFDGGSNELGRGSSASDAEVRAGALPWNAAVEGLSVFAGLSRSGRAVVEGEVGHTTADPEHGNTAAEAFEELSSRDVA